MSRWTDVNDVTVPKAATADNAKKFNNQDYSYYERAVSGYQGTSGDTNDPGEPCVLIGGGEYNWTFYKTIYYTTVNNTTRRCQIAYPGGTSIKRIKWRMTAGGNLPDTWNELANVSDLVNTASLDDLERIVSLETKEERLKAIATLKAEKLLQIQNKETMIQNDVIEHNSGGGITAFRLGGLLVSVRQKGGQHEQVYGNRPKPIRKSFCSVELPKDRFGYPSGDKYRHNKSEYPCFIIHRLLLCTYRDFPGWRLRRHRNSFLSHSTRDCRISGDSEIRSRKNLFQEWQRIGTVFLESLAGTIHELTARKEAVA